MNTTLTIILIIVIVVLVLAYLGYRIMRRINEALEIMFTFGDEDIFHIEEDKEYLN